MKILHVAWLKASYGGAHKYLDRLVQRLVERKCDVTLAVNQQELERPFLNDLRELGVRIAFLPMKADPIGSAARLDRLIEETSPDLLHFNSGARQPREVAAKLESWNSVAMRSVFTMHLPLIRDVPTWGERMRACVPYTFSQRRIKEKHAFAAKFDQVISVSQRFAEVNIAGLKLNPQKMTHIPNGVDIVRFKPKSATGNSSQSPVVVGACGGLVPQKRFDLLIEAIANLKTYAPTLRIAGEGPERIRLQGLINKFGLQQQVHLVGHQSDIPAFLQQLDVFVMSSDYEAFPYSQLEAMATGLPSVVTDVGDLPLMVRDRQDGIVFPAGDAAALQSGLQLMFDDPNLRQKFGKSARDRVVNHFERNDCELRTFNLFKTLVIPQPTTARL